MLCVLQSLFCEYFGRVTFKYHIKTVYVSICHLYQHEHVSVLTGVCYMTVDEQSTSESQAYGTLFTGVLRRSITTTLTLR